MSSSRSYAWTYSGDFHRLKRKYNCFESLMFTLSKTTVTIKYRVFVMWHLFLKVKSCAWIVKISSAIFFKRNTFELRKYKYNLFVGLGASHDKEGSVSPTVCGGIHDTAEREGVPRVLLHLPQDLPPTVRLHPPHPAWRPHQQVSHTLSSY